VFQVFKCKKKVLLFVNIYNDCTWKSFNDCMSYLFIYYSCIYYYLYIALSCIRFFDFSISNGCTSIINNNLKTSVISLKTECNFEVKSEYLQVLDICTILHKCRAINCFSRSVGLSVKREAWKADTISFSHNIHTETSMEGILWGQWSWILNWGKSWTGRGAGVINRDYWPGVSETEC
jgi:hypothetical protein